MTVNEINETCDFAIYAKAHVVDQKIQLSQFRIPAPQFHSRHTFMRFHMSADIYDVLCLIEWPQYDLETLQIRMENPVLEHDLRQALFKRLEGMIPIVSQIFALGEILTNASPIES